MTDAPLPQSEPPPVWPYVLPLATFLALTALEGQLPTAADGAASPFWYPITYAIKIVVIGVVLWFCRSTLRELSPWPSRSEFVLALVLGLIVAVVWVGSEGRYPRIPFLSGQRIAFDPSLIAFPGHYAFLAVRMLGLVVVVPIIEELFYRSFLMRWLIDPDITRVPIGRVTPLGLAVTSIIFALSHPEWLAALLTGIAWGWLVGHTRSLSACVLSHAMANLALGVYVLATGSWCFW